MTMHITVLDRVFALLQHEAGASNWSPRTCRLVCREWRQAYDVALGQWKASD